MLRALRQRREEHSHGARDVDPGRELVAAVAHHVHAVHSPHEEHDVDGIPCGLAVHVGHHGRIEWRKCEGDVEDVAVRGVEDRQIAMSCMVPLMDLFVHRLEVMHQCVHCKEIGVVEDHYRPCEEQAAYYVARDLHPAYEPMSAPSPAQVKQTVLSML